MRAKLLSRNNTKSPHPYGVEFSIVYTYPTFWQGFGIKFGINLNTLGKP